MSRQRLADQRVSELGHHGSRCHSGIRALLDRLGDGPDEARSDDHAVRSGVRRGPRLGTVGDAETERDGHRAVAL